jgi:hypothetical protein
MFLAKLVAQQNISCSAAGWRETAEMIALTQDEITAALDAVMPGVSRSPTHLKDEP